MSKLLLSTIVALAVASAGFANFTYAAAKDEKSSESAMSKKDTDKKGAKKKDTDDMKKSDKGMEKGKDKGDEKGKAK